MYLQINPGSNNKYIMLYNYVYKISILCCNSKYNKKYNYLQSMCNITHI